MAQTATERVREINERTRAWVAEDPANRWSGVLVEDPEHWCSYGIHTADDLDRYLLGCTYDDVYKSVYGIRPRHVDWRTKTLDELQKMLEDLPSPPEEDP